MLKPLVNRLLERKNGKARMKKIVICLMLAISCTGNFSRTKWSGGDFIDVAAGGGFTGRYSGYTLFGNGILVRWESQRLQRTEDTLTRLSDAIVQQWFQRLDSLAIDQFSIHQYGNYQYRLRYGHQGDTLTLQWTNPEQIPSAVWIFYQDFQKFAQQHSPE